MYFLLAQKPIKDMTIGASISVHPKSSAHQGNSSGFSNSAIKLTMNDTNMMVTSPYRTMKNRGFGKRSPVALNISWSSVSMSNFHPRISVLASSRNRRGNPTA